jgi:hypothetical protein
MKIIRQVYFLSFVTLLSLLFLLTACSEVLSSPTLEMVNRETGVIQTATPEPMIDVCEPLLSEVAFPRQEPVDGPRESMAAELVGELVLEDGCLRIESIYGDGSYLTIWLPEFKIIFDGGVPVVLDGEGVVVGKVGEEIYMGGGEGREQSMLACVRTQLPPTCGGPYWLVGEGVRLNLILDSDLLTMDFEYLPDRTAILLKKEPILDEWVDETGTITGFLRFYFPNRCPRIQSDSGMRDFLPLWPQGYTHRFKGGLVEILDQDGVVIARQDELVTLSGGLVPTNWENENYRQLHYETPGDCFGPYWIVMP